MAVSKNSNGIAGGHAGESDEPISAGTTGQASGSQRAKAGAPSRAAAASRANAAPKASAGSSSRIASRPARAVGADMRSMAEEGPTAPLGYADRKYSFNALLAAGFLGYVLGRLISR